jgi:hypothetical protein
MACQSTQGILLLVHFFHRFDYACLSNVLCNVYLLAALACCCTAVVAQGVAAVRQSVRARCALLPCAFHNSTVHHGTRITLIDCSVVIMILRHW